jgi:hypothetical protein
MGGAAAGMQAVDPDCPALSLEVTTGFGDREPAPAPVLTQTEADLPLVGGGRLRMLKDSGTAHFDLFSQPPDEELLHPYLAPAAALHWQWAGHEALHAGVIGLGDRAILLLGDKESGKSTTLGYLAMLGGTSILADDLAIIDGREVLAGPRSLDLRPGSELPGQHVHSVRGDRLRMDLGPAPARATVAGVAVLEWGATIDITKIGFSERMHMLARQRTFPSLAADPVSLLDLASTPVVRATRPRDLGGLEKFAQGLLDYFF